RPDGTRRGTPTDRDGPRRPERRIWPALLAGSPASAVTGKVCREARGVRCGGSQGGGSSSYWAYSGDSDNAARCRAGRREPVNLPGHGTRVGRVDDELERPSRIDWAGGAIFRAVRTGNAFEETVERVLQ